jgi:hypothetical protein
MPRQSDDRQIVFAVDHRFGLAIKRLDVRRRSDPMNTRPTPNSKSELGSGMVSPLNENVMLYGPWWVMSVPIRSQSGSRLVLRIHA